MASIISDGGSIEDALTVMSRDPSLLIEGTDKLQAWMQERSDEAIDELGAAHFDIPDELRRLECRIAPTRGGGIYYTEPSDDFARPGRMWWSPERGRLDLRHVAGAHDGLPRGRAGAPSPMWPRDSQPE